MTARRESEKWINTNEQAAIIIVNADGSPVSAGGGGGTSSTDDSPFVVGVSSLTPSGGIVTSDPVDDGDVGAFAMLTNRQQKVSLYDSSGVEITSFGGGTQYTEDAASAANPVGGMLMLRRRDTLNASEVSGDGDNIAGSSTAKGELYVKHVDTIPVTDNGGSLTVDGTIAATQSGAWNITNVSGTVSLPTGAATAAKQPALGTAGTASSDVITVQGIASMTPLLVTASAGTNLNTSALALESGGNLATIAALSRAEDAAHASGHTGIMGLSVRQDTAAALAGTDADYQPLITDASGRLHVNVGNTVTVGSHAVTNAGTFAVQATLAAGAAAIAKAEDVASADADVGVPALAVRKAAPANTSGTDGDYEFLQMSAGRLWTSTTIDAALPAGSAAIGKLTANDGVDIGDVTINNASGASAVNIQDGGNSITVDGTVSVNTHDVGAITTSVTPGTSAAHLGKAEDAAHSSGDTGVLTLAVRRDANTTLVDATGDYAPLQVDASGSLKVAITAGAGSGGTSLADNAAFTPGTTSFTPIGGEVDDTASTDVTENSAGIVRMTVKRAIHVNLRDASGNELSVGGGTQYDEDAVSAGAEKVTMAGVVRRDAAASSSGADGDISTLAADASGRLWVNNSGVTQPVSGTVAATQSGTWTVQPGNTANTTAWKVDGSAVTQPVSAATLPLPTGAATLAKQPSLGTAGAPSADVITVQGATGMTALAEKFDVVTAQTAAWTSATALDTAITLTVTGYTTVAMTLNPTTTFTGGVLTFEVSDDAGTTWYPITATRVDSFATDLTYTIVASTKRIWQLDVSGFTSYRVRLSTAITGTGTANLRIQASAASSETSVTVGQSTATNLKVDASGVAVPVTDNSGSLTVDAPVGTPVFVRLSDGSAAITTLPVSLAANQSVNVAQIGGNATSTAASGVQKVGVVGNAGATVDSTVGAGSAPTNQVVVGGIYNTSAPAPTNGQAMAQQADQAGNHLVAPGIATATLSAWNSVTALNATQTIFTKSGVQAVLLHLVQTTTLTAGAVTVEVSYDGTNYVTISSDCVIDPTSATLATISLPYTVQASTNKAFLLLVKGAQAVRIKLSTQITGTGAVTPNYALLPYAAVQQAVLGAGTATIGALTANQSVNNAQISGTAMDVNSGTKSAGTQRVVLATDQPALTNALLVTAAGDIAHDGADSGNPVKIGARARSSEITAVANNDRADLITDLVGKQIVLPYANPENFVSGAITTAMTGTTSTSLVAAPAAGLRNYITQITVSNAHATVGTDVIIQDGSGGTTLYTIPAAAVYGGATLTFPTPLRQPTTATAIFCANVTTGASTKVSASGYKGA